MAITEATLGDAQELARLETPGEVFFSDGFEAETSLGYIKFAADYDQGNMNHTGGGLADVAGSSPWGGMGQAGIRPDGS